MRGFRSGASPVRAGLIAIVLIAIATFFAFAKDIPFTKTYTVQAVFENSNLIQPRSPVRIAGIDVGKVVKVERYKDTKMAVVTMEVKDQGRPIHTDATLKIRPRLFLEGNFYIDMRPGSPGASEVADGGMIPVGQTSTPVQLDQVLTALQSDTRVSLQKTLKGLGQAFGAKPSAADDADQDPSVQGLSGGQALNEGLRYSPRALRDSAIVLEALRGEEPHDLSRTIKGLARATGALAENESALRDLISGLDVTTATLAARAPQLTESVSLLGPTAATLRRGFTSLDRALPPTRAFARDILPGVRATPGVIAAAQPWLPQARAFLGPNELGGLLDYLAPTTAELAGLAHESRKFLPEIDAFNRCATEVLIPTANLKIDDGPLSANEEVYKEFWYSVVGQAGVGQSFDGNGSFLRLSAPGGANTVKSGPTIYSGKSQFANFTAPPLSTRPAFPGKVPPLRRDVPCYSNSVPDLNGPASTGPADGSRPNAPHPPEPDPVSVAPSLAGAARLVANPGPPLVPLPQATEGTTP